MTKFRHKNTNASRLITGLLPLINYENGTARGSPKHKEARKCAERTNIYKKLIFNFAFRVDLYGSFQYNYILIPLYDFDFDFKKNEGKNLKLREFLRKRKKAILSGISMVGMLVLISVIALLLMLAFDIIYFEDGFNFNTEIFDDFKSSWYGWCILILLQILITSLLCFIPGISMAYILLLQTLMGKPWQAFSIAFIGVMLTSAFLYILGRFGGYHICVKLMGQKDCEKASALLNHRGVVFFPLMMIFPIFPDDALVMIAGTLKMSMKWFIPSIVVGRGIGIATITFGLSLVPFHLFTTIWHWAGFVVLCAAFIFAVFYFANKLSLHLEHKAEIKEEQSGESAE